MKPIHPLHYWVLLSVVDSFLVSNCSVVFVCVLQSLRWLAGCTVSFSWILFIGGHPLFFFPTLFLCWEKLCMSGSEARWGGVCPDGRLMLTWEVVFTKINRRPFYRLMYVSSCVGEALLASRCLCTQVLLKKKDVAYCLWNWEEWRIMWQCINRLCMCVCLSEENVLILAGCKFSPFRQTGQPIILL